MKSFKSDFFRGYTNSVVSKEDKQITKAEYDEMIAYYKHIKQLPHPLMITSFENGTYHYVDYDILTDDVKVILNNYKKVR